MDYHKRFLVPPGHKVNLSQHDPDFTGKISDKDEGEEKLQETVQKLTKLQDAFYADGRTSLLCVFQAMDTGGKDGVIRRVFSGVNPQGCRVKSFKVPSQDEQAHDFLWRVHAAVPPRGYIGIFNRSHYEEVLIVRVHKLVPRVVWSKRYHQINQFEEILAANNVVILKFFLHISKDEQKERLEARLATPEKNWKSNPNDWEERKLWSQYQKAYEEALGRCSTKAAPWFVIPANKKWFRNLAVARIIVQTLEGLRPRYPSPPPPK